MQASSKVSTLLGGFRQAVRGPDGVFKHLRFRGISSDPEKREKLCSLFCVSRRPVSTTEGLPRPTRRQCVCVCVAVRGEVRRVHGFFAGRSCQWHWLRVLVTLSPVIAGGLCIISVTTIRQQFTCQFVPDPLLALIGRDAQLYPSNVDNLERQVVCLLEMPRLSWCIAGASGSAS